MLGEYLCAVPDIDHALPVGQDLEQELGKCIEIMRSENKIDKRIALLHLLDDVGLLHHAAAKADDHVLLIPLNSVEVAKTPEDMLVRVVPHRAGVVDDDVRVILVFRILKARFA